MYWRFGEATGDPPGPLFLYDELCHRLRYGEGPWIRLPHHPALILTLLLHMQRANRTVSSDQIRAFLHVPKNARIKDHVTELRKKLAEAGGDPTRVLEHVGGQTGYRLSPGVHAGMLLEADALSLLDELLASPEPVPAVLRTGLLSLRGMLLLSSVTSVFAVAITGWLVFRPGEETPIPHHFEEGDLRPSTEPRTLIPGERAFIRPEGAGTVIRKDGAYVVTLREPGASVCFELPDVLKLSEQVALLLDLGASSSSLTKVDIVLERDRPEEARTVVPYELHDGARPTVVRIPASELDPRVRGGLRRVCLSAGDDAGQRGDGAIMLEVQRLRLVEK